MQKPRRVLSVIAVCLLSFALTTQANDSQTWADLMARMWRAFTALERQHTDPRSRVYPPYARVSPNSLLDGMWESRSGALLLVRAGRARLYLDRHTSQDFDLRLDGQSVVLRDRRFGSQRRYAYALQEGRLVMQDADGNLLLLRRLPKWQMGR